MNWKLDETAHAGAFHGEDAADGISDEEYR